MQDKIAAFIEHVSEASQNPDFVHHTWFVKWHLQLVEQIAHELEHCYPQADSDMVLVMVWLHDYGKILDYDNQYAVTLTAGRVKLLELGFAEDFVNTAIANIETLDKKLELDIAQANIEVQIVSSADGLSHFIGPFMQLWWLENAGKSFEDLMADNKRKATKDWTRKIVLPEARKAAEQRYKFLMEQSGDIPARIIASKVTTKNMQDNS